MTTDQHVTLTLVGTTVDAVPRWSLVDPAVPLDPGKSPFQVAYIVTLVPSADGQTCLVSPKGRTVISDGLGAWEVQVHVSGRLIGRASLFIAADGPTGLTPVPGSSVVASALTK
jgi:hypothetical protein